MGEQRNRWSWDLPLFEPRSSLEREEQMQQTSARKLSLSPSSLPRRVWFGRQSVNEKFQKLTDQMMRARQDYLELRHEAIDLREYSNAKLDRVTRYLRVLADRSRKLDQAALEAEARIGPLLVEKRRLFNELLTNKGNIKVFCRVRPPFEDEGPSVVEFPDDFTIRIDTGDDSLTNSKRDYEFDRVYGPHIGQGELFHDVRPYVQSAIDGYNVSIFAYGQTSSGKTHTMSENTVLADKLKLEQEQNAQLRNQVSSLLQHDHEQKIQMHQQNLTIQNLQAKIKGIESKLTEALSSNDLRSESSSGGVFSSPKGDQDSVNSTSVTKKLEEELSKRDALIEKLHQENEKLFDRLSEKSSFGGSPQVSSPSVKRLASPIGDWNRSENAKARSMDVLSLPSQDETKMMGAIVKIDKPKTPAGEYLTAALMDFNPDQFESFATVADGANKLLMLVLAAVIKAGAAREHEILAEIRDAVFSFIRKMEPRRVMDTMLVSRVRILYIRSLLARSPELQSIKVSPVGRFLEKATTGRSRNPSRSNSPGRSSATYDSSRRNALIEEHIQGFKINIRQEKKSKLSSLVLKLRGIDEETWRQHVTGGKLREITEEAKSFSVGNKVLAALFVHTPAGELQRQIRSWLAENFEFLSVTGSDPLGGTTGELELLSTAIMDGWMAGLGAAHHPHTDALGLLLSEYTKRVYTTQLQHLKDIAGTLAMEEAEDQIHVNKLRSALESVDHKRRKILQQMRGDTALISKEEGGSPIRNPSTAAEDARLASLIALDEILKQVREIMRQASAGSLTKSKKETILASLNDLSERMPSLLDIDHPCAKRQIFDARREIESIPESLHPHDESRSPQPSAAEVEVTQWNVLQFNTGSTSPFIIKCGANSHSELVIKADSRIQEPKGSEIIRVLPRPSILSTMNYDEIKQTFDQLPEAVSLLALARTADGTRARYSRLFRTLAMKVPSLRDLVAELEKGGMLKDAKP